MQLPPQTDDERIEVAVDLEQYQLGMAAYMRRNDQGMVSLPLNELTDARLERIVKERMEDGGLRFKRMEMGS